MSMTATLSLKKLEEHFGIQDQLSNRGYYSIFDILKLSKSEFTRQYQGLFGAKASKIYDTASGYATQIMLLFRKNNLAQAVQTSVYSTQLQDNDSVVPTKGGPTWQTLFTDDWREYCQNSAPEANDSPVSYLSWLYNQATNFESQMGVDNIIPLAVRRPDLAELMLDNDAINQVVPSLQLVNKVLEQSVTPYVNNIAPNTSVSETLAATRYSTLLPYHYPHQQTLLSLKASDESLQNTIKKTDTAWPYFVKQNLRAGKAETAWQLGSDLAPEQQNILIENFADSTTELTNFYYQSLGLNSSNFEPFVNSDVLCQQLGITKEEMENLIASTCNESKVSISDNYQPAYQTSGSDLYGASYINNYLNDPVLLQDRSVVKDEGTNPTPMYISSQGVSFVAGKFGSALKIDATKNAEVYFKSNIATDGSQLIPFTLSFWCNIPANINSNSLVVTNKTDHYVSTAKGITVKASPGENGNCSLELSASDGENDPLTVSRVLPADTWIFVCIEYSLNTNLYLITNVNGSGSTHYDTIQIDSPESIALEEEYWGFNGNYGNKYYEDHSSCRSVLLYDDIAVWNKNLSDSEINTYLSKGTTALALNDPIQYYSCDAADVSITKETSPKIEVSQSQNEYYPELLSDRYGEYYKLCATKNNYIRLNDTICNQFDGNQDFSFGFWFKYSERPTNRTPVAMNIYPENGEHGFSIELYSSGGLHVIAQNDHNYKNLDTAALTTDTWYYVALVWCTSTMVATLYLVEEGSSDINVYETNAVNAGSFTKNGEFCWTLNESGNVNRTWYTTNNDSSVALCFSEPAFWSGLINQNDVALIASLQSSLDDKDSGLSLYPACYFDFNTCPTLMHLSDVRMQRINRMVRLQRWLGLSFEEVDLLINACIRGQGSQNSDNSLNAQTLRMLGVYRHWQQAYQVTAFQFATILYQITPYAISPAVPFLDQVFNTASAFDEPFKITDRAFNYTALTGEDGQIVKQICTGLSITRTQFLVLAKQVSDAQNCGANTLICSLDVISALYRLVMTPRWLGLSFEDGVALLMLVEEGKALARLANIPVYTAVENSASDLLDTLMALSDAAQWLADNNLTATWALAMLHDGEKVLPATTAELNFVTDINQQLSASLVTETSFNGIASPQLSPLTFSSYSVVTDSPTGNGFQLDSTQNQYAQINGDINQAVDGLENYTIGVWVNIPQKLSDTTPLLVNATIKDTDHLTKDIGIYLLAKSSNNITPGIHDLNQDGNSGDISFTPGTWFYLAAVMNTENKKFTVYIVDRDTQQLRSKQLNISSVTSVTSGNRWALNQDGALQYYNIYPNRAGTIQYDNLTVWNESLTEDDIKEISASSEVAGGRNDYIATTTLAGNFTWTKCFDDLLDANGLIYPVTPASGESVNSQIEKQVRADIQRWHLPQTPLTHEQIAESAATIIASAKQSQDGIADSALAKAFNIDHSYPPYLLAWAASSEYDLLSQSLALNGITTPDTVPDEYQQYLYQIARRAGLCHTFNLTPAMLSTLLAHPAWFGVADTTIDFNLLYLFSRYSDWMKLADKEDAMLAYLRRVNGTPSPTPEQAASCLALLTDWESDEVLQAAAHADPATGIATTLAHIDVVMRLKTLCTHTGTSVETMLNTGDLTTTSTYQEWQSVGESLVAAQSNH
ncbi:virulence protein SpvA [Salmonella enterica]|nr:virulence protein SpvA [Salmonella enterica subsp. arizonae]EHG2876703.1 virulence protein SpvA [Salmonella enterica]EKO1000166.1 virulence protein SpvA [Salmonella enterica subsp. enterica]ELS3677948.1 virulence protein SpvA [Salmonella enterica]HAU3110813.1 virulence protein SpvA [Salmonella enterica subsp. diarizonae]